MKEIFISHGDDGEIVAKKLLSLLHSIEIPARSNANFTDGMATASHALLLISPGWIESSWAQFEHHIANHVADPAAFVSKLIPLVIAEGTRVPALLKPLIEPHIPFVPDRAPQMICDGILAHLKTFLERQSQARFNAKEPPLPQFFILGHPGSGKSSFADRFKQRVSQQGFVARKWDAYIYMQALFRIDELRGNYSRFRPDQASEFLVEDPIIYEEAVGLVRQRLLEREAVPGSLDVAEFSFSYESNSLLIEVLQARPSSAIVHIEAPLHLCEARNQTRGAHLHRLRANDADYDFDSDIHYVPPQFYSRYRAGIKEMESQLGLLAAIPARGYFRMENSGSDLSEYHAACDRLIDESLLPLLK